MTQTLRRSTLVSILTVLALTLAACGGSDTTDLSADEATETTAAEEPATTTEAAAEEPATTTTEATTTTTEATTTTETTTTVAIVETDPNDPEVIAFCAMSAEADERSESAEFGTVDGIRAFILEQQDLLASVDYPEAIAGDMATIEASFVQLRGELADVESLDDAFVVLQEIGEQDDFVAAGDAIDAWEAEFCPVVESASPSTTDNPLGITEDDILTLLETEDGRAGMVQGITSTSSLTAEEATCFLDSAEPATIVGLFQIGVGEVTEPSAEVQAGLIAALDACGLDISAFGG